MSLRFFDDLNQAQKAEKELAEMLNAKGYVTTSTADLGSFSGYDLVVKTERKQYSLEVKNDLMYNHTGFVAVELYKSIDNIKYKSGLTSTTADYQIYKLGHEFFSIKTSKLKLLLKELKTKGLLPIQEGGDDNTVKLALVMVGKFKRASKKIN